jgi:HSP20 family protein
MDMFRTVPFNLKENVGKGQEAVERLLEFMADQPGNPMGRVSGAFASFRVDVIDTEAAYELFGELPGFRKEQITVSYDEDEYLRIRAERAELETEDVKYICRERRTGEFERVFKIDGIDKDSVSVAFDNGILHIVLPKVSKDANRTIFDIE